MYGLVHSRQRCSYALSCSHLHLLYIKRKIKTKRRLFEPSFFDRKRRNCDYVQGKGCSKWYLAAAGAVAGAAARRGKQGRQRTVFIQAVQKGDDDRQGATAKKVAADRAVLVAKYQNGYENPKGTVPMRTTIHKKPPEVFRRICKGFAYDF